ncbi:hypothetical protein CH35J_012849 [Colletotrichum higginsianum]|uniref:Uncharacterized protein n=1 Tax=Colletotrichum higginsianum TaxID=80884 RepID=A0A4T0VCQ7_9PEZI|nr:hypothetical protein CH35J_012849 [Colletotrichum higginsianum]
MDPYARYTAPNIFPTGAPLTQAELARYTGGQALTGAPPNSMLLHMAAPGQAGQAVQLHPSQLDSYPCTAAVTVGPLGSGPSPAAPANSFHFQHLVGAPGRNVNLGAPNAAPALSIHPSAWAQANARAIFNTPTGGVPGRPQATSPLPIPVTTGQLTFSNYNPAGYGGYSSIVPPTLPVNTTVLLNAGTAQ